MSPSSLSVAARLRKLFAEGGGAAARSLERQMRTHGANIRAVRRGVAVDHETAKEIERAAAPLRSSFSGDPVPDHELRRSLQRLFGGEYGRKLLRVEVTGVQRASKSLLQFELAVYQVDRKVGTMSRVIRTGRGKRLIAEHENTFLDPSVRGMRGGGFFNEFHFCSEQVFRALGARHIRLLATGDGTWTWYKAGFQFNPAFKEYNRGRLIAGIDKVLGPAGIGVNEAEEAALESMRRRLRIGSMPTVAEIAKISDRPSVGKAVLSTGWEGIRHLDP